ncbi:MAG: hypothetical protein ACK421_10525 [Pseudanabaenaceae cyanobacterium]
MRLSRVLKLVVTVFSVLVFVVVTGKTIAQTGVSRATVTAILESNQVFIQERQAKLRDVVQRQQQVRTGAARAELTFDNKAVARLGRNTRFTVGECGVQLQQGSVLVSGVSACTNSVTAAVRGTTYIMTVHGNGKEEYQVLEGRVEFNKTTDPHQWAMEAGDKCFVEPDRQGVVRAKLSQGEYVRQLRGWAFRGFEMDQARFERLRTTYSRLFPNTRFPLRQRLLTNRGNFILTIHQRDPQLQEVIVRIAWQRKRNNAYLPERFVGDFLFPINQKAQFRRGIEPFERISIRLFDRENRFLGYTEWEGLDDNAAVSVILPSEPELYGTLRTVVGEDSNQDGVIDPDAFVYDFFSSVKTAADTPRERTEVIFVKDGQGINRSAFTIANLPPFPETPEFPDGFYEPLFSPLDRSTFPFRAGLEAPLLTVPGRVNPLVPVSPNGQSVFDLPKEILKYRSRRLL